MTARLAKTTFVSALFVASGMAGLAYEVIWFKRLAHVWGSSALAIASVLASYLLALGAGAKVVGRMADRWRSPFLAYGLAEVGIGALALAVPFCLRLLEDIAAALYPLLEGHPVPGALARSALTLLVLGPPCFLMGGTFPLLVKELTPVGGTLRDSTGLLYAANTLGGALGAYLTGFHLLPALGLPATNALAVAVNLSVGVIAIAASRWSRRGVQGPADPTASPVPALPENPRTSSVWLAALLSGCASLALQIGWTRQLSLILGGSTYAFTAMLFVVLLGIGLGGLVFHLGLRGSKDPRRLQAIVSLALLATVLLGQLTIEPLTFFVGSVGRFRGDAAWNGAVCVIAAMALELLPSIGMGILLPLYAAAIGKGSAEAGSDAGALYAWNTAGTLVGALGAALCLLPALGTAATLASALAVYLLAALALFPAAGSRGKIAILFLSALGIFIVWRTAVGPDPVLSNLGLYLYGAPSRDVAKGVQPLLIEDGMSTTVMVSAHLDGTISLRVNGKVDASTGRDMPTQAGLAYFPRIFRPEAQSVLVIGLGSGTTSGASLLFPGTRVTCAEIERVVARATALFSSVNHWPWDRERFRLVLGDGRSHVQGTRERYDLILSEPSNPWLAGVSSLFTLEFYQTVKARLTRGGVLAQWLQSYSLSPADYAMQVRTIQKVFPHGALIRLPGTDTVILASESPLDLSREAVDRAQALFDSAAAAKSDLERYFGTSDVRSLLVRHRILGDDGLRRLLEKDGGSTLHTDLNLRLEFDAPLRLFDPDVQPTAVKKAVLAASVGSIGEAWGRWGCEKRHLAALRELLELYAENEEWPAAEELIELGLRMDPADAHFLAARFMVSMPDDDASWDDSFARLIALSPEEAARVGVWLHLRKDFARAVKAWKRLLETHPQAATLWINLGASLEAVGAKAEARQAAEKAQALDPFSSFVRSRAEAAQGAGVGSTQEAAGNDASQGPSGR